MWIGGHYSGTPCCRLHIHYIHTVPVKIKFPLHCSKTLQSHFHVGKKTFNDLKKWRLFIKHWSFFYLTVVYFLIIYARLTICAENLFLLHPLIARLSTEAAAFFAFRLLRRQLVCFWMHSDVHFCFSSLSFSLSSASPSFVVARHGLFILSLLLLLPSPCHSVVYFAFLLPLSAS